MKQVKEMPLNVEFVAVTECCELWAGLFKWKNDILYVWNYDNDEYTKYPGNIKIVFKNAIFYIKE